MTHQQMERILEAALTEARTRIAYLEGCAEVNAKMIAKTADDVVRYKRQAEKAEAALTEARARLAAADRMAEALAREAIQAYRKETGHDE